MNSEILKKHCKESLKLDLVRICDVNYYEDLKLSLIERYQKNYITGMEESDIEKRVNPKLIMENAKSIIVIAFPYYIGEFENSNLSKYCISEDYHLVTKRLMQEICDYLSDEIDKKIKENENNYKKNILHNEIEKFEYKYFSDTGVLSERYLASKSGIGYLGVNNNIITDKYGSYVFLGYIVNNYNFEKDEPLTKTCCKCMKCVQKCPTNALLGIKNINDILEDKLINNENIKNKKFRIEHYEMDSKKCLSYLTQKKEELTQKEIKLIKENKKVFGCDICQDVCPHNKNIEKTNIKDFYENIIEVLELDKIQNMSNKEFKKEYSNKAFSWRGKKIIARNLEIINSKD